MESIGRIESGQDPLTIEKDMSEKMDNEEVFVLPSKARTKGNLNKACQTRHAL